MPEATSFSPLTVVDQEVRDAASTADTLALQLHGRTPSIPAVLTGVPHLAAQEFATALAEARSRHEAGLRALASYFNDAATGLLNFETAVGTHESDHAASFSGGAGI